ncbi:MAG: insulinase family protein [Flavobacteriales bacterium]|nr:insulinase family protein [Flavobacteriales bacterium]
MHVEKTTLSNGLRVIVHPDKNTALSVVNVLYDVGARDENPHRTGFAHLFEHLMFEGTQNVKHFDRHVQDAGGTNNAFTSNDITNYYISLPAGNTETGLWLEADRMGFLDITQEKLDIQKKVVIEEFKERYLNQPYGDVWAELRKLAYTVHPYQWPTIGKNTDHVAEATLEEVQAFHRKFYNPCNAVLCVAGNVNPEEVFQMTEKWFGALPGGEKYVRNLPQEPEQTVARKHEVLRPVPQDLFMLAFPCPAYLAPGYAELDLASDILGGGESSRLYQALIVKKRIFTQVGAYVLGSLDRGLLVISGRLMPGVTFEKAEKAVWEELDRLQSAGTDLRELEKIRNKMLTGRAFENDSIMNKATKLCAFELLGDANMITREEAFYAAVTPDSLRENLSQIVPEKSTTLYYKSQNGYETN